MLKYAVFVVIFLRQAFASPDLLIFGSDFCHFSQKLVVSIGASNQLSTFLSQYEFDLIDMDQEKGLSGRYHIHSSPTMVFLDENGQESWRESGFSSEESFLSLLKERMGQPDGLPAILKKAELTRDVRDLHLAARQLLGRGQNHKVVRLLSSFAPKDMSVIEESSLNRLRFRAEILSGFYDGAIIHVSLSRLS